MDIDYNAEKLQAVADTLYDATGVHMMITISDFYTENKNYCSYCRAIQNYPTLHRSCVASDKRLYDQCISTGESAVGVCHGGVFNAVAPIKFEGGIIGFIFICGVRRKTDRMSISSSADFGYSDEEMERMYRELVVCDEERISGLISLADMMSKYLISSGIVRLNTDEAFGRAKKYIKDHLGEQLSVESISRGANISKSALYRLFDKHLGCTLGEYINEKRIAAAVRMLVGTELSIDEVAKRTGYNSTSYFRRVFKKVHKTSPLKYRVYKKEKELNEDELY